MPLVLLGAYASISGLIKAELYPPHIRTLGVALPYAVGNTIFGGTAEYAALWFKQAGARAAFLFLGPLTAIIGMAAIAFLMLPETKTRRPDRGKLMDRPRAKSRDGSLLPLVVAVLLIPAALGSSKTIFNDGDVSWASQRAGGSLTIA